MQFKLPEHYKLIFSKEAIEEGIAEAAKEISQWISHGDRPSALQPIALCILRGGSLFFADLVRSLSDSVEMGFCRSWTYSSEANLQFDPSELCEKRRFSLERCEVANRDILLIDDICDTGGTMSFITKELIKLGASSVKTATLIHREVPNSKFQPDWKVFTHKGDEWFVGYGMEDCNRFSNLPEVYAITPH